jgi:hypothetical protein
MSSDSWVKCNGPDRFSLRSILSAAAFSAHVNLRRKQRAASSNGTFLTIPEKLTTQCPARIGIRISRKTIGSCTCSTPTSQIELLERLAEILRQPALAQVR